MTKLEDVCDHNQDTHDYRNKNSVCDMGVQKWMEKNKIIRNRLKNI